MLKIALHLGFYMILGGSIWLNWVQAEAHLEYKEQTAVYLEEQKAEVIKNAAQMMTDAQVMLAKDARTGNIILLWNGIEWKKFEGVCRPEVTA